MIYKQREKEWKKQRDQIFMIQSLYSILLELRSKNKIVLMEMGARPALKQLVCHLWTKLRNAFLPNYRTMTKGSHMQPFDSRSRQDNKHIIRKSVISSRHERRGKLIKPAVCGEATLFVSLLCSMNPSLVLVALGEKFLSSITAVAVKIGRISGEP